MRVREEVVHVEGLLNYIVGNLDAVNWDWASWDDMYGFIEDRNADFIHSNYVPGTFTDSGINIIIASDSDGETVYGRYLDFETAANGVIPDHLIELIE